MHALEWDDSNIRHSVVGNTDAICDVFLALDDRLRGVTFTLTQLEPTCILEEGSFPWYKTRTTNKNTIYQP